MISSGLNLNHDHLVIRFVKLRAGETWSHSGEGLLLASVKAGAARCRWGKTMQLLAPGDVFVINLTAPSTIFAENDMDLVFWYFSVCVEHLFPLFGSEEISGLHRIAEGLKVSKVYAASSSLAERCHRLIEDCPTDLNLDQRAQLLRVVSVILSLELKNPQLQRSGNVGIDEHVAQVFERLSVVEILKLPVPSLAKRFGCTRRHLNRLFHRRFGFSVSEFRMEMRLMKAASLLRDPALKVIDVAAQCDFTHLGLFNSCFKRRFGTSPGRWRKSVQTGALVLDARAAPVNCPCPGVGLCPWSGPEDRTSTVVPALDPGSGQCECFSADEAGRGRGPGQTWAGEVLSTGSGSHRRNGATSARKS